MTQDTGLGIYKELVDVLLSRIDEQKYIPEDVLRIFLKNLMEFIHNGEKDQIAENYGMLSERISAFWHGKEYVEIANPVFVFQMGQVVACVRLIDQYLKKMEEKTDVEVIRRQHKALFPFLQTLAKNPGIKQKDLADCLGKSTSAMSHFIKDNARYGLFSDMALGREKYYSLTAKGKKFYEEFLAIDQSLKNQWVTGNDYSNSSIDIDSLFQNVPLNEQKDFIRAISLIISDKSDRMLQEVSNNLRDTIQKYTRSFTLKSMERGSSENKEKSEAEEFERFWNTQPYNKDTINVMDNVLYF